MWLLDVVAWIALLLLGFGTHESLALPDWLMPLFAVPAFVYLGWRRQGLSRDGWADLVLFLVVGGAVFFAVERLPAGWQDERIVAGAFVVALAARWTVDRISALIAAGRAGPAGSRPAGGQEA